MPEPRELGLEPGDITGELWHRANKETLHESLGLTWDEYARWVEEG